MIPKQKARPAKAFSLNEEGKDVRDRCHLSGKSVYRKGNRKLAQGPFLGKRAGKEEQRLEKKISLLFDFHRFEKNKDLQAVIDAVHARYTARKLTDDEAEWVAAAGTPKPTYKFNRPKDEWK